MVPIKTKVISNSSTFSPPLSSRILPDPIINQIPRNLLTTNNSNQQLYDNYDLSLIPNIKQQQNDQYSKSKSFIDLVLNDDFNDIFNKSENDDYSLNNDDLNTGNCISMKEIELNNTTNHQSFDEDLLDNLINFGTIQQELKFKMQRIKQANKFLKKKSKREKPTFKISKKFYKRILNYWNIIENNNENFKNIHSNNSNLDLSDIKIMKSEIFLINVVPILLSNNLNLNYFNSFQGIDGWFYEKNLKRKNFNKIPIRWCNQKFNFYEPYVKRFKIDLFGNKILRQSLCPYCPINEINCEFNNLFHSTFNSQYLHHLTKFHGIYSSGIEILPPILGNLKLNNKSNKNKNNAIAVCLECGERCKIFNIGNISENCLINYFRHAILNHNKKKNSSINDDKEIKDTNFIYEDYLDVNLRTNSLFDMN